MVPLGRGEAAAAAVAGSRGGKSRSWTWLGLELLGGCGTWAPCRSHSRLRLHSTHPRDPTPSPFPWGWVSSPPSLVSMETRTLPLFAQLVAPRLPWVFFNVALDYGCFPGQGPPASLSGVLGSQSSATLTPPGLVTESWSLRYRRRCLGSPPGTLICPLRYRETCFSGVA